MRLLSAALEAALASGTYQPACMILAYDPTQDKMPAIVNGVATQSPVDLTGFANDITWSLTQMTFSLTDPDGSFNPDSGLYRKHLMDRAVVRLLEGDARVDPSEWMVTFTGQIRGNIGWQLNRSSQTMTSKVTVFSRDSTLGFKRRQIVSDEYTVGTDLGFALYDVADYFMGLDDAQIRIPRVLGCQFLHKSNQLVEVTPWDGISALLEVVCQVPFFDGEGKLAAYSKNLNRTLDRIIPDWVRVVNYEFPERSSDLINRVRVIFLDANLTKVPGPDQVLGTASVTTGFFKLKETLECWWSDDRRQRAENTRMVIKASASNGTVARLAFGFPIMTESYKQIDEYHGKITIDISVFVPLLATATLAAYLAAAMIPDEVEVAPLAGFGITIPTGRTVQALLLGEILLIMMCLGTGQYEIWGTPYDYVYLEKDSVAYVAGLEYFEENPKEIKNDFIGSHERADALAICELTWEQSLGNPRKITLTNDLSLELGDIFALADGKKFCITNMSKTIKRGEVPLLNLECFKVLRSA